jgi:hypothetical protein
LFHSVLDYLFLKTFGCACWPNLWPYNSHKLQPRSLQCVFLGYSFLHHSYKCLHIPTGRLYISGDVIFLENLFPFFQNISTLPTQPITPSGQSVSVLGPCPLLSSQAQSCPAPSTTSASTSRASYSLHTEPIIEPIPNPQPELIPAPNTQTHTVSLSNPTPVTSLETSQSPDTASATHPSHPSSHSIVTRSKNHITKPKLPLDGMIRYPLPKALLALLIALYPNLSPLALPRLPRAIHGVKP